MKRVSKLVMAGVACLLLAVTLVACGDTAPSIATVTMGRDFKDGSVVDQTTAFKASDKVLYAVAKVDGTTDAAKVRFVWTAVSVVASGSTTEIKDRKIVENTVALDKNTNLASSQYTQTNDLPVGKYKVEVFLNDKIANTTDFTVS